MRQLRRNIPIDSKGVGKRNEIMILAMLRKHGRMSQTELCRLAKIGSSTASTIVARLRDKGLIVETLGSSERRGPKPTLLELNPKSFYVIGVEINPSYLHIGLFSFGEMKHKGHISLGSDHSVQHIVKLIGENVSNMVALYSLEQEQILGMGVSLSGSVSSAGDISISSPMGWKDVPLKKMLSLQFNFPILVYSSRVRLLAEFEIQPELASRNILYLNLANGVGSTMYMEGNLVSGATGRYGEIGHIVIDSKGPQCGCGNSGCLEASISGPALAAKIKRDFFLGKAKAFTPLFTENKQPAPEEFMSFWAMAIEKNDSYALEIRNEVADLFSRVAAISINCFDPDVIILAGYISRVFPEYLAESIREKMKTEVYDSKLRKIEIILARGGDDAIIKGAAVAVLQDSLDTNW